MQYGDGNKLSLRIQIQSVAFPEALDAYLGYMRVRITEELAWLCGSPLYTVMAEGGGGSAEPGSAALLEVCLVYRLFSSHAAPHQPPSSLRQQHACRLAQDRMPHTPLAASVVSHVQGNSGI